MRHASQLAKHLTFVKQVSYDPAMLQREYPDQVCSIARSLEVVGERWTLLILRDAMIGAERFEDFQESLGIAIQRPHQPAEAAVRRRRARAATGREAARPTEVRPHRQGPRARANADHAHQMG